MTCRSYGNNERECETKVRQSTTPNKISWKFAENQTAAET